MNGFTAQTRRHEEFDFVVVFRGFVVQQRPIGSG
jgi:hypothetical protein